ncbi:MAG: sensor histidine kinase [Xanthomonadales bacterium]|jgi:two-component system sensor histidine kinase DesK|nr:sensor histidine kinase [Xanthomonadales bacterium]
MSLVRYAPAMSLEARSRTPLAPAAAIADAAAPLPGGAVRARARPMDFNRHPWFGLVYLAFVFLPLIFARQPIGHALLWSVLACAAFVPVWQRYLQESLPTPERTRLIAWTALLGYTLMALQPGGNTFVIYAITMAVSVWPPKRGLITAVVLWALMAVELFVLIPNPGVAIGVSAIMAMIAGSACAGILADRARERQDALLRLSQDEVRRLAAMAERERIGRDLHDVLGHTLSLVVLKTQLARRLLNRDASAAEAQLAELEQAARGALDQVREAVSGIRSCGLAAELAAARLSLLDAEIGLDVELPVLELPAPIDAAFALALREAITNVIRHARASRVRVQLSAEGVDWRLTIVDDGIGGARPKPGHSGLPGFGERARALGGELKLDSPAGGGTRIELSVPRTLPVAT